MKRILTLFASVLLAACMATTANAATMTSDKALAAALKDAGLRRAVVNRVEVELENGQIEVEFRHAKNKVSYEYVYLAKNGRLLEKSVDYPVKKTASKAKIGKKAARKVVSKASGIKYSIVKKGRCSYKRSKGVGTYKVSFNYKGYRYEYELFAPSGKVVEWEMEYRGK